MELTAERENFVKLSHIIVDIVADLLRTLFKRRWNERHEMWRSDSNSGNQLWKSLGEGFRKSNKGCARKIQTGNEQLWDITTLCKIFLYSDLKFEQSSSEYKEIGKIREIRNEFFANPESMACSDDDFKCHVAKIKSAVKILLGKDAECKISAIEKSPITQKTIEQSDIGKRLLIIFLLYGYNECEAIFNRFIEHLKIKSKS